MAAALAAVSQQEDTRKSEFELLKARLSATGQNPVLPLEGVVATTIPELDSLLGGGLPNGVVATLEGATGRWSLAAGLVAGMTRRSLVAILDDGTLYPPALADAGVCLERVLVVPARTALAIVRAVDLLLRSRICRLVLMPALALRDAVWARLAKLAHRSGVLLIVVAERAGASLSAAAGVRLHCVLERIFVRGTHGLWGSFAGFELCIDVRKHKRMSPGRTAHVRVGNAALR
ncbi:MAG TPA: hypothetical protein VFE35_10210 [Candidatus Cybelea sp.]|jgi:hypothetical protein|nr:hypothetical protein [Candidatus Cybelea sp.]